MKVLTDTNHWSFVSNQPKYAKLSTIVAGNTHDRKPVINLPAHLVSFWYSNYTSSYNNLKLTFNYSMQANNTFWVLHFRRALTHKL